MCCTEKHIKLIFTCELNEKEDAIKVFTYYHIRNKMLDHA